MNLQSKRANTHAPRQTEKAQASEQPDPLRINPNVLFMLIKEKQGGDLFLLYAFLVKECQRQRTNQPWCTVPFCAKGLGWNERKVSRLRGRLIKLGALENVPRRNEKGHVVKWYVRVRMLLSVQNATERQCGAVSPNCFNSEGIEMLKQTTVSFQEKTWCWSISEMREIADSFEIPEWCVDQFCEGMEKAKWKVDGKNVRDVGRVWAGFIFHSWPKAADQWESPEILSEMIWETAEELFPELVF